MGFEEQRLFAKERDQIYLMESNKLSEIAPRLSSQPGRPWPRSSQEELQNLESRWSNKFRLLSWQ